MIEQIWILPHHALLTPYISTPLATTSMTLQLPCSPLRAGADNSRAHAISLLPSQPLEHLPLAPAAVRAYLADWEGMRIPVAPQFYNGVRLRDSVLAQKLESTDSSMLPLRLTGLLLTPEEFGSELTTTFAMAGRCLRYVSAACFCLHSAAVQPAPPHLCREETGGAGNCLVAQASSQSCFATSTPTATPNW